MLSRLRRFIRDNRGLAAVEFAFVGPIMITMFFGATELSMALSTREKVVSVAASAADLAAQSTNIDNSDMTDIMNALKALVYPNDNTKLKIVITSVIQNGTGSNYKVVWSDALNGTARAKDSAVTIPTGLITSGSGGSVIMAEVTYAYASPTTQQLTGTVNMTNTFYARPRRSLQVTRST